MGLEACAVVGGGFDVEHGDVDGGGNEFRKGLGVEIWERREGGNAEVRVESAMACGMSYLEMVGDVQTRLGVVLESCE